MAHHIFRRCLLADVVPPVPPPPVTALADYRLVVAPIDSVIFERVAGVEFGSSVAGLDAMSGLFVPPIPPGVDTGLGYYRIEQALDLGIIYSIEPIELHGSLRTSGATI